MKLHKIIPIFIAIAITGAMFLNIEAVKAEEKLPVYFFWGDGCPHCAAEKVFLNKIKSNYPDIEFLDFEIYNNESNKELFMRLGRDMTGKPFAGVPVIVIGEEYIVGYLDDRNTGAQIEHLLNVYQVENCQNPNHNHNGEPEIPNEEPCDTPTSTFEQIINYPLLGDINLKSLSLPALTAVLGTLDGFNPCSMWALMVLITLLINTGSKKKMWIVGITFILVSAFSYFLFLAAWLNAFLFIGYLAITRIIIAILAIGVGVYFLRDWWKNRKSSTVTCEVTSSGTKNKLITKMQKIIGHNNTLAVIVGIALVAFSVNLIELFCSAGLPTIYTKILTMNQLPKGSYYLYILAYDFFYMLDDIVVLVIAGFTFRAFAGSAKFSKYSHLIGGILILVLGIIMLLNPNLLMI